MQNFLITARTIAKEYSPQFPQTLVSRRADRKIDLRRTKKKLLVEESTQETKTEKETSRSRVEADENRQQTFQKTLRAAAPPLKDNNSTSTTTKMFADIVQKTQTKPPLDNRNFSFPKSATKKNRIFFTNITKDLYQSRRGEKTDQFLLQQLGFFFPEFASNAKNTQEAVPRNKSKAVVGKETTKSSATPCTYTKQPQTIFYSTIPHLFFTYCPVILT